MASQDTVVDHRKFPAGSQNAFVHTLYGDTKVNIIVITQASMYRSLAKDTV